LTAPWQELNETPAGRVVAMEELKRRLAENTEGLTFNMDEAFLIRFLRNRKFNVDRAYTLVCNWTR
jgi:hypothetical protein